MTQYITDVPEVAALAPCAFSALGYAVKEMVREAPGAFLRSGGTDTDMNMLTGTRTLSIGLSSLRYLCLPKEPELSAGEPTHQLIGQVLLRKPHGRCLVGSGNVVGVV